MEHPIRCACGVVRGTISVARPIGRAICYCRDCQTYAHALGGARAILDADGGSDVAPTVQHAIRITQGHDAIACLSLTDNGLLRWHSRCCNTPLGNTGRNPRLAYIGLLHTCLERSAGNLDAVFGPASVHVNTQWATRKIATRPLATMAFIARLAPQILKARISGNYKRSPFFDENGRPVVSVRVLARAELDRARQNVRPRA